jgi:uncharacterized Fe-S center protein
MPSEVFFLPASEKDGYDVLARKTKRLYEALGLDEIIDQDSFVGIKIHFGEKGTTGYIKPPWLKDLIRDLKKRKAKIFITDTNTLYIGNRSNSVEHLHLAERHGFSSDSLGIPVIIADGLIGRDCEEMEVNLAHVKSAKIASTFFHTDVLLCLSHFTGHVLSGFGAAIKNLGMGCASRAGKLEQHSDVHPWVNPKICTNCSVCMEYCPAGAIEQADGSSRIDDEKCIGCGECLVVCTAGAIKMRWDGDTLRVQEKMAEYAYAVQKSVKKKIGYLNYLIRITKDCDCMSKNGKLIAEDIGIVSSLDPVAVDKASVDLLNEGKGLDILRQAIDVDWSVQLDYGEKIGLGTTKYVLKNIL